MSQTVDLVASEEVNGLSLLPASGGVHPIQDLAAFLAELPGVETEATESLERAIAENRLQRRSVLPS